MSKDKWSLFLSCEHGGFEIPRKFATLMCPRDRHDLPTHRGWDKGALRVAQIVQKKLGCPLQFSTVSRLLVDLNRSVHHRSCLGVSYRGLSKEQRSAILDLYYWPHRSAVESSISQALERSVGVLHVGVHSFTPVLRGEKRRADLALLYDPGSPTEKKWVDAWINILRETFPGYRIRRNYPYRGISDALTTGLRRSLPRRKYAGIELEINQRCLATPTEQKLMGDLIAQSISKLFAQS